MTRREKVQTVLITSALALLMFDTLLAIAKGLQYFAG